MSFASWLALLGARYGRLLHGYIGGVITAISLGLAVLAGPPVLHGWFAPLLNLFTVIYVALAHEQAPSGNGPRGDLPWSDFLRINGGPSNGILDVLAFLPVPVIWCGLWVLCG